jgi:NADH-quinone oxidoreductase subunit J
VNPLAFLVVAALTVGAALMVVLHRNPVHSALGLVSTLFLLSVLFVGLDAEMVAVLQIIVYAGAVVVLFLFVIMLLNLQVEVRRTGGPLLVGVAASGAVALGALLVRGILGRTPAAGMADIPAGFGSTVAIGERLFTAYLVPFELTSLLLLVAVIGAVVLAKKRL